MAQAASPGHFIQVCSSVVCQLLKRLHVWSLVSYHVKVTIILRIELSVSANRRGRVSCADGQLLEDLLLQGPVGIDGKKIAILAVGIGDAVFVNRGCVDAPFKAVWVITYAGNAIVRVARATQCVGVLEHPLDAQARTERSDEVSLRISWVRGRTVRRAYIWIVTIRSDTAIVVVLSDDRVGAAMSPNGRSIVPPEDIGIQKLPGRTETQ